MAALRLCQWQIFDELIEWLHHGDTEADRENKHRESAELSSEQSSLFQAQENRRLDEKALTEQYRLGIGNGTISI
jgi:hypothetical protein